MTPDGARSLGTGLATVLALAGCGGASEPPLPPPVAATVPFGSVPSGARVLRATLAPPGPAVTPSLLAAGERAYLGKCAPCHGQTLAGDGPVVRAGFPSPGPLDMRELTPEDVVAVVTHGRGEMPALGAQVAPLERWAIARWLERR